MPTPLPFGRAIIHRKSGRCIGPIAPIFKEDYPYRAVASTEQLWRYLEFYKFEDMLTTSTFYFTRPDKFQDPFEGLLSPGNHSRSSESDLVFRRLYRMSGDARDGASYHETHRKVVFILCWHRNNRESRRMWLAYTKNSSESIAVVTSGKALGRFLPCGLLCSTVKYHDLDEPRTEFDHNSLFFFKPLEYAFEREYRLLRQPKAGEDFYSNNPDDEYRRISIPLKKVIHRVIAHPDASPSFKGKVEELLRKHLRGKQLESSSLLAGRLRQHSSDFAR